MLILFSLQIISVYLVQSLEQYYLRNYKESLENQARLLSAFVGPDFSDEQYRAEDTLRLARGFRGIHDMEIIVLDSYAQIVGTSGSQVLIGRRLLRDEITRALSGNASDHVRFDPVSGERRYYLAYPMLNDHSTIGVIYMSGSLKAVDDTLREIKTIMLTGVGLALVVSFILGAILTRTITTPIKEVTDQAHYMAQGDFTRKIDVRSSDEIGRLGESFNYLAEQLSLTVDEMSSEKSKVEAIINNMSEGVAALDGKGLLIQINPSARRLIKTLKLKVPPSQRSGFNLLRNLIGADATRQFIRKQRPLMAEIVGTDPNCTMQVKVAPFKVEKGKLDGTLIVMHDVTRERELARRQEEFVADVSHELKTPLTTVKSYVETLLDGAAEDRNTRYRFLEVLSKETDRMVSMVKDLLVLSQMDAGEINWRRANVDLRDLVCEAVDQVTQKSDSGQPLIEVDIPADFTAVYVDRSKVMRVFSNLLNNALKYTPSEGMIKISAKNRESMIEIVIEDSGSGIPDKDLPRIFERFYRVEKTRSRDYGGSGLGLSIARKVVEAHGGVIMIESTSGVGTKVLFTLPCALSEEASI